MTTLARIVDGFAVDIQIAATAADLASRFNHDWLAKHVFYVVADGTLHGCPAVVNADGSVTCGANPTAPIPDPPAPINTGNPYFGKRPIATKDFWALIGQVLPSDRFKRLTTDSHFLWIDKVIDKVSIVDVDDKAGQFLQIITYLSNTNGDDTKVLVTPAELQAIMAAWK